MTQSRNKQPKELSKHDLQQWISETVLIDGVQTKRVRLEQTHLYNSTYQLCKGEKKKLEARKWLPGTFFKIVDN